jgi:hypothetical protein
VAVDEAGEKQQKKGERVVAVSRRVHGTIYGLRPGRP